MAGFVSDDVSIWAEMLLEAQRHEKPLKLVRGVTKIHALKDVKVKRIELWPKLFYWATLSGEDGVALDSRKRKAWYEKMKASPIPARETKQIEKDLPRTVRWLSDGEIYNPFVRDESVAKKHISELRSILHAWVAVQLQRSSKATEVKMCMFKV